MVYKRNAKWWREYRKRHPEVNKRACKKYWRNNKKPIMKQHLKYRENNPDKVLKWTKTYIQKINVFGLQSKTFGIMRSKWSKSVLKRDRKKCQICQKTAKVSHHLFYKALYPALSLNINNGISLCVECHKTTHGMNLY